MMADQASRVTVIAGDIRRIRANNPSPMTQSGTNSYLIGTGQLALIDPGPDLADHRAAILAALQPDEQIEVILVSHCHLDHTALVPALAAQTGAKVLAYGPASSGRSAQMQRLASAGLTGGGEGLDFDFRPDATLRDGDIIALGASRIEVLHTPGHTGCHLCFGVGDRLFSGDHVMGWSTSLISPPEGDMTDYMTSLRRLAAREWQQFLPGHGDTVPDPALRIADLVAHRTAREAEILASLTSGPMTPAEITARLYVNIPAALIPAAQRNVLAHLIDLTARAHVTCPALPGPDARFRLA